MTTDLTDLPYVEIAKISGAGDMEYLKSDAELHAGDVCPQCLSGRIDYDGMLNLTCPECGYSLSGCFT
jgi:hypothetical protein